MDSRSVSLVHGMLLQISDTSVLKLRHRLLSTSQRLTAGLRCLGHHAHNRSSILATVHSVLPFLPSPRRYLLHQMLVQNEVGLLHPFARYAFQWSSSERKSGFVWMDVAQISEAKSNDSLASLVARCSGGEAVVLGLIPLLTNFCGLASGYSPRNTLLGESLSRRLRLN